MARTEATHVLMTADAVGGVWSYTVDMASALNDRGIGVTIAVMGPPPSPSQARTASRVARLETFPCKLEWMDEPWDDVRSAGEWLLDVEDRATPDVVHLNGYCHAALRWRAPAMVVAHSCVRTWWRAVHGDAPPGTKRYHDEVARGLQHARVVVAPTAAMLAALRSEYEHDGPGRVIPNGRARRCASHNGHTKEPIVFAAGRVWDAAKNIESVCAAAAYLSWPVFVAGDTRAPGGGCASIGYARHLGRLDGDEIQHWYDRASIYALPARYEPFGLSILEAAISGCALVLGDIPSLRENWSGAAVFVPSDNRRALTSAVQQLIDDPVERARLSGKARERACQFTLERMAQQYLHVYSEMLS